MNGFLSVGFSRIQPRRGKIGAIGRIWEMLGFQTERTMHRGFPCFRGPLQMVAGIELNPRFRGGNFENSS